MKSTSNKSIVVESYNSIDDFIKTINTRKNNVVFGEETPAKKLESYTNGESFTKTKSYNESIEIMLHGYKEGLESIRGAKDIRVAQPKTSRQLPQVGIVGFVPHVPNAIAGIPQSMISTQRVQMKSKVISIMYNSTCSGGTPADNIVKAGRNLLDLIMYLETKGYRVQLEILISACKSNQQVFGLIKVKGHRQPINPLKIAYALVHPSFFRRQGFRWIETVDGMTEKSFIYGYGIPLSSFAGGGQKTAKFLKDKCLIKEGVYFTDIDEAYKVKDVNELADKMGISINKK